MPRPSKRTPGNDHPVEARDLKRLLAFADTLRRSAPWEWLFESQVFGLRPQGAGGQTFWVNVIGGAGEVFAVNLFIGDEGFRGLCVMMGAFMGEEEGGEEYEPVALAMEQRMYQIEFVTKAELDSWDRKALKKAGRSLPTRKSSFVPRIVSGKLGYTPWRLESEEAKELLVALEALEEVLEFMEGDPAFCPDFPSKQIPVFDWSEEDGLSIAWEETEPLLQFENLDTTRLPDFNDISREKYRALPLGAGSVWEVALTLSPTPIGSKTERPYFPFVCFVCDQASGRILGMELFQRAEKGDSLAKAILAAMDSLNVRPGRVLVEEAGLLALLGDFLEPLGVEVVAGPCIACEEAFDQMYEDLG